MLYLCTGIRQAALPDEPLPKTITKQAICIIVNRLIAYSTHITYHP